MSSSTELMAQKRAGKKPNNTSVRKRLSDKQKPAPGTKHKGNYPQPDRDKSTGIDKYLGPVTGFKPAMVEVGAYSGNVPMKSVNKQNRAVDKANKARGNYSGMIPMSKVNRFRRAVAKNDRNMGSYSGNIRYVDLKKMRAKKYKKMSEYRGFIRVKKAPHKATTKTRMKRFYNKPYDSRKLKKGLLRLPFVGVKKADIPRYQREKVMKPKYDKDENEIWAKPREVPVKPKESKTKVDDNQDKE